MAGSAPQVVLHSSARPHLQDAELIGEVEEEKKIHFTIFLKKKDGAPELPDLDFWQKTPIHQRQFLTPQELAEKYGSSEEDAVAVSSTLKEHGIEVVSKHLSAGTLTVVGTPSQIKSLFGVQMKYYKHETPTSKMARRTGVKLAAHHLQTEKYHGYEGKLSLPLHLDGIVPHVVGLDNRSLSTYAGFSGDPKNAISSLVTSIAEIYNFPVGIDTSNQVIGILNCGGTNFSFNPTDVTTYFSQQAPGYQKPPTVVAISPTIGSTVYTNNAVNASYETSLDIQTAATIAQGCTVNVYFGDNSEQGWTALLNRATFPEGNEKAPTVISNSWVLLNEWSPGYTFTSLFQRLGALGATFFTAAGDWGSDDLNPGTQTEHVGYPASDPWVTSVGGTVVGNIQQTSASTTFDEYAWSDMGNGSSQFFAAPYGATGGGMSTMFPTPPYQIAAGVVAYPDSSGTMKSTGRFLPDISAHVGYSGIIVNGFPTTLFGTSASSPLMAGLFASYRARLQNKGFGLLNPTLYQLGKANQGLVYNDILVGNNDNNDTPDEPYWNAKQGYDPVTGWGSVKGMAMLNELAILYGITLSSTKM